MYRRYTNDQSLSDLEEEARVARRGLWADPDPIPPWGVAEDAERVSLMPAGVGLVCFSR